MSNLENWTLVVAAIGVAVATIAFVWNQLYGVYSRRRDS